LDTSQKPKSSLETVTGQIEKYRLLVWIIGVLILSLGFGFKTPQAQFQELRDAIVQNQTAEAERMSKLEVRVYQLEHDDRIGALLRLKCSELSAKEIVQFDVPCTSSYNPVTP
jgi:hypothetical protein